MLDNRWESLTKNEPGYSHPPGKTKVVCKRIFTGFSNMNHMIQKGNTEI